jgi:hypothetical protein
MGISLPQATNGRFVVGNHRRSMTGPGRSATTPAADRPTLRLFGNLITGAADQQRLRHKLPRRVKLRFDRGLHLRRIHFALVSSED